MGGRVEPGHKLKSPHRTWLWCGVIAASVLPMAIGVWRLVQYRTLDSVYPSDEVDLWIGLTFLLGTPIVAALASSWVQKDDRLGGFYASEVTLHALKATAIVQFLACVIILGYGLLEPSNSSFGERIGPFLIVLLALLSVNMLLYVLVSGPLAILCALIFRLIALEPVPRDDLLSERAA